MSAVGRKRARADNDTNEAPRKAQAHADTNSTGPAAAHKEAAAASAADYVSVMIVLEDATWYHSHYAAKDLEERNLVITDTVAMTLMEAAEVLGGYKEARGCDREDVFNAWSLWEEEGKDRDAIDKGPKYACEHSHVSHIGTPGQCVLVCAWSAVR